MEEKIIRFYKRFGILSVFASALLLKLFFIFRYKDRLYGDAIRALIVGKDYFLNSFPPFIHNKTYLGPLSWFFIYQHSGIWGLKVINIMSFIALFAVQYFIGRKVYKYSILVVALFLFSFYVGTNLNVIAGEQDDSLAMLLFSLGILWYLKKDRVFLPSLLMGIGFLFKFSIGVFYSGFIVYLVIKRKWKRCLLSTAGMLAPFICVNLIDHFHSLNILLISFGIQSGFSSWGIIYFKLFSTGMLFSFLISLWVCIKEKSDFNTLFFWLSSSYLFYVLLIREAHSASSGMMQSLLFSSFLIATFLFKNEYFFKRIPRPSIIVIVLVLYLLITTAITAHNIHYDTHVFRI